jgi:hypothetical protein
VDLSLSRACTIDVNIVVLLLFLVVEKGGHNRPAKHFYCVRLVEKSPVLH